MPGVAGREGGRRWGSWQGWRPLELCPHGRPWSEEQPSPGLSEQPHSAPREAAGLDTPQGRAGCSQVQGDTLDQSEINLYVIKRRKHSVCTNPS